MGKRALVLLTSTLVLAGAVGSGRAATTAGGPPASTAAPVVTGSPKVGQWLTTTPGQWTGRPTSATVHWQRCDAQVASCYGVPAATATRYFLTPADAWYRLRVVGRATNAAGLGTAFSTIGPVIVGPPRVLDVPTLSGTMLRGQAVTTTPGAWAGSPTAFYYQWQRCAGDTAACFSIGGATSSTYPLANDDAGHRLRVLVTAKNGYGTTISQSKIGTVVK